jgi:hypothetical protein
MSESEVGSTPRATARSLSTFCEHEHDRERIRGEGSVYPVVVKGLRPLKSGGLGVDAYDLQIEDLLACEAIVNAGEGVGRIEGERSLRHGRQKN